MRNDFATRHLDEEELVQFLDRELPRRRYAGAREHVGACWKCQTRFSELQSITAEIVRLDEKLATLAGGDLGDWPDLRPRLRETRRSMEASAPHGWAVTPFWARLALATVALVSLGLGYSLIVRWSLPSPPPPPRSAPARSIGPARRENAAVNPVPTSVAPRTRPPGSSALSIELSVIQALHRIGADTGEPVQVADIAGGGIRVIGKGLSVERESEIRTALAGLPDVTIRFDQLSTQGARAADSKAPLTFTTRRPPFAQALEAAAGGAPALEALTNSVLDESEEMMAAAHAWRNLERRFPADRRQGMNAAELAALGQIEADHTAAARTNFRQIERQLTTALGSLGQGDGFAPETNGAGLFDSARRLQRALNAIFGGDDSVHPLPVLLAELTAASRQMDRTLEAAR